MQKFENGLSQEINKVFIPLFIKEFYDLVEKVKVVE